MQADEGKVGVGAPAAVVGVSEWMCVQLLG